MHNTTKDLQKFYDSAAESFSGTRKRHWPEFTYILWYLKERFAEHISQKKALRVIELWCGDGRLLGFLEEHLGGDIIYTWVDISYNLLAIANSNHPTATRVHSDMCDYMSNVEQESVDCVIGIASFHHLPTIPQRVQVLDNIYSCLQYEGCCLMTNWCYSNWFKAKYKAAITKARWKSYLSLWYFDKNDIMVPWKNPQWELLATRLYHIFSPWELGKLFTQSWFTKLEQVYISSAGEITPHEADGRNLISSGVKSIYG